MTPSSNTICICGSTDSLHCQECHGTGTGAWDFDNNLAIPCATCKGTGRIEAVNTTNVVEPANEHNSSDRSAAKPMKLTNYAYACPNRTHEFIERGDEIACIHCATPDVNLTPSKTSNELDNIRNAMIGDFNDLYVREFTTSWETDRKMRQLEIDVMTPSRIATLIESEVQQALLESYESLMSYIDDAIPGYVRSRIDQLKGGKNE